MYAKVRIYYLFQDNTLERTTNGKGIFAEQNSDYIDSLDAGSWFSHSFKGEKIPRFTEYLAWIKGKAKVYIDVKYKHKEVVDIIREQEIQEDCFFYFRNSKDARKCFWGKAKFEFRISEAKKIKEQFVKGEDVSGHYFLFEHGGNRLNAETVKWCQKNTIILLWLIRLTSVIIS